MTYKLGDRVVVTKRTTLYGGFVGKTGTVTAQTGGDIIGVTLDDEPDQYKTGRIYFSPNELEHDKNYIVNQLLSDL